MFIFEVIFTSLFLDKGLTDFENGYNFGKGDSCANRCMGVHKSFRHFGTSDSKYYDDSRCGMSDVAFLSAPPIGGLSALH